MMVMRPVDKNFRVSSPFGPRIDPITKEQSWHKGIDFACPVGTPVKACFDGTVLLLRKETEISSKTTTSGKAAEGNRIGIYTKDYIALYFHLEDFNCAIGQAVKCGDVVGFSGSTGRSTGPHLHFELRLLNTGESIKPEFEDNPNADKPAA